MSKQTAEHHTKGGGGNCTKSDYLILCCVKNVSITVTEAARNFADCVNRVRYQDTTFILLKNGKPIARLVPAQEPVCTGRDLSDALARVSLSAAEAESWRNDLAEARKTIKAPVDKWR